MRGLIGIFFGHVSFLALELVDPLSKLLSVSKIALGESETISCLNEACKISEVDVAFKCREFLQQRRVFDCNGIKNNFNH